MKLMKEYLKICLGIVVGLTFSFRICAQAVNADTFEKGMHAPAAQIFDVRTAQEYNSGHINGALMADYTNKKEFEERVKYLSKQAPVYVYCLSGGRSAAAAKWMRDYGFKEVV